MIGDSFSALFRSECSIGMLEDLYDGVVVYLAVTVVGRSVALDAVLRPVSRLRPYDVESY